MVRRVRDKKLKKRRLFPFGIRKRVCRFCKERVRHIDYKDVKKLEHFLTERGKIVSTRASGNCAKHQRMLTATIKRARFISLIPYIR